MTTRIEVQTATSTYPFVVGSDILNNFQLHLKDLGVTQDSGIFVITDETVYKLGYAAQVATACKDHGFQVGLGMIPPRDESKSLQMAESLYEQMLEAGLRRNGVVLALGGGVVGDLAGFVAATYLRGIRFVQVPTTLLAHDSSIGGKVGINLKRGKNLVGAFHQPAAVLYDVGTLKSLPGREWRNGMAEVIKHAIIGDKDLFEDLEQDPVFEYPGPAKAESLIAQASQVKIRVVEQDVFEQELRMWLNLGHTVGHAVEQVSHYQLGHGEAISIGMSVEACIAAARGWLSEDNRVRINRLLAAHGLPITPPKYPFDEIISVLQVDKKHTSRAWTFVLPKAIGEVAIVRDVTYEEVQKAWEQVQKESTE